VRFVPPQDHHLLSTFYRAADVCLMPSRSESFGLVALEAAACGTPVIAAAVGGLTTLVRDGVSGLLIDARDPARWAAAIDQVLGDRKTRERLGAGAAVVGRGYSWSTTAARLRRLYTDLAARVAVDCGAQW
jgi:D-inositol-3-phosphate glycosyltransferase